jgi:5-methylcytosine-specific restriction enzyme A
MSNGRRPGKANAYRGGYLSSGVWFARRARWFRDETQHTGGLRCAACERPAVPRELELHHIDYSRVIQSAAGWVAGELHGDLLALHPAHHELLHRLMDRDRVLRSMRTRTTANHTALQSLRRKLAPTATVQP